MVYQTVDNLVPDNTFFNDFLTILCFDLHIQDSFRLNAQKRPHLTKSMTAGFFQTNALVMRLFLQHQ